MKTGQGTFVLGSNVVRLLILGYSLLIFLIFIAISLFDHIELANIFVHSTIETSGAVASIVIAVVLLILISQKQFSQTYAFLAYGFMSMGVLDILHASVEPSSLFVWLHSATVLTGGFFFAGICLPQRFFVFIQKNWSKCKKP